MKVLFQSYNTCCQNTAGGVQKRIKTLYKLLNQRGIQVDFFDPFQTCINDYDILHVFMLEPENHNLIREAKRKGLKIVISTIVSLNSGKKVDFHRVFLSKMPFLTTYKMMINSVKLADLLIVETPDEYDFMKKHYKVSDRMLCIIPNGYDCCENGGDEIFEIVGRDTKYVLQVGRFDTNKNQLSVITALKGMGVPLVFIGGEDKIEEKSYYKRCLDEANGDSNIHFLGWLPSDSPLLKSAYVHADVFVLPSFCETFGLVLLEAGIAGAKLAISNTLPILKYNVFDSCETFNPKNVNDIKRAVEVSLEKEKDDNLRHNIQNTFKWDVVADKHIDCYREIMS